MLAMVFAWNSPRLLVQSHRVMNHLYCGDNLQILREHIKDESVDLVYLAPPIDDLPTGESIIDGLPFSLK